MNRMGHPFDWSARKRRGSGQNATDGYEQYFNDDVDFPHFGSTWDAFNRVGNKRSQQPTAGDRNDRSGFFDYLPQEFRQYIPDNFGFGGAGIRHAQQPFHGQTTAPHPPQGQPQQQPPHPQQQQQQQYHEPSAAHGSANSSRSNLCDAAIQTEDPANAMAPSAATHSNSSSANASSSSVSSPYGSHVHTSISADGPHAYANASASNPQTHQYSQSPHQQYYPQNPGRQYDQHPYGQSPQGQFYQRPTPASSDQAPGEHFVRHVPIFIEGSANANAKPTTAAAATATTAATAPTKIRPDPIICKDLPVQHDQQQQQQQQSNQNERTPSDKNGSAVNEPATPQTPHTIDCITKIQAIQRDVLELMCNVEQFGGKRGDKDYAYLDEMLTRNLLKLDTIDTNGKDSIRMARKEAIKCIQASIAVLEAKADLHLNGNQATVNASANVADASAMDTTATEKPTDQLCDEAMELGKSEVIALPAVPEKMDTSESTDVTAPSKQTSNDAIATEIPIAENSTIDDGTKTQAAETTSSALEKDSIKTNENTSTN